MDLKCNLKTFFDWWHSSKTADIICGVFVLGAVLGLLVPILNSQEVIALWNQYYWLIAIIGALLLLLLVFIVAIVGMAFSSTFSLIAKSLIIISLAYGVFNESGLWTALSVFIALIYVWDTRSRIRQLESLNDRIFNLEMQDNHISVGLDDALNQLDERINQLNERLDDMRNT